MSIGRRLRAKDWGGRSSAMWRTASLASTLVFGVLTAASLRGADTRDGSDTDKAADKSKARDSAKAEAKDPDHQLIQQLLVQIDELRARVADLEAKERGSATAAAEIGGNALEAPTSLATDRVEPTPPATPTGSAASPAPAASASPEPQEEGGHNMTLPGGPKLNIRGFLDFNADVGTAANPLVYPLTIPPPVTVHDTFQFGEFDLFMSSHLSDTISFLSEVVLGADASNFWGLDVERAQISYKPNQYFQISGGRMHTVIGFYNTTYHHGTWFQTATGRPYMYFYEDSGGILPVHIVGIEVQGLVPKTGSWNAHWIAEVGNGESSLFIGQPIVNQPVQNFVSDTDHKAFNVAGYIKPDWLSGLQIGGNYYNDERVPTGIPHVNNIITGAYVVYMTPVWEFMNECQVQKDHSVGSGITYNTPLCYTQFSRKVNKYRPYVRWQEVNVPAGDPLYGTVGRFEGPSFGVRMDFTSFAALKVQYNRIYTRDPQAKNGLDSQVAFTF
jgi:hypothetical protein